MKNIKSKRLQLTSVHGKRVNMLFPPATTKEDLSAFKSAARRMIQCQRAGLPFHVQDVRFVQVHGDFVRKKLKLLGISLEGGSDGNDEKCVLAAFASRYTSSKRGETEQKLIATARRLERFFGAQKDIREITQLEAHSFRNWLIEHEGLAEKSTARRAIGYASQIMQAAVNEGLVDRNPFIADGIPRAVLPNPERRHYITPDQTQRIWQAIQTDEDRIRFVLLRYLGLRAPSEIDSLTWADFDWGSETVIIRSSKLKHHNSQGLRRCPISHPDVLPILKAAYEGRKTDDSPVVTKISAPALRRRVIKWLGRAGLDVWPALLNNFRRSAVTDALNLVPKHVASAFFGHSAEIAERFYAMETAAHRRAFATATPIIHVSNV